MTAVKTLVRPNGFEKSKKFFKSMIKVIPFTNMFVPEIKNESKGVYMFGKDNKLPNKLMNWVLDSGTAKRAVSKRSAYIAADGFVDENAANFEVSPNKTADKLLTEISGYLPYFKGFVLHVKREDKLILKLLPFQDVRKRLDGAFEYNPTWSSNKYDNSKTIIIEPYKKDRNLQDPVELAKIKDNGEIVYAYHKSADNPQYPIPDYYAGIEDIRTSSELQKLDYEAVVNGFIPSAILTLIGGLDDKEEDSSGMTEKDYFDEELIKFTGGEKDSEGRSGRMKLLVTVARNQEEIPKLQPFDAKAIIDASNSKREIIDRSVSRLFGVHPMLLGFADPAGLGNQQAMANASQELNNDVISDQQLVTETLAMIYPEITNWDITTFRPIQFIPDKIMDKLTNAEIRALVGYAPLEDTGTSDKILADILGVGGTSALTGILVDTTLSAEQKQSALQILFGLNETDAKKLAPDIVPPTPPVV